MDSGFFVKLPCAVDIRLSTHYRAFRAILALVVHRDSDTDLLPVEYVPEIPLF